MQAPFISHRLRLEVAVESGTLSCRAILDGDVVGIRSVPEPYGMGNLWEGLGRGHEAEGKLISAGRRLGRTLLDEAILGRLAEVIDGLPPDSVLEIVVEANPAGLSLPYELIRLPDDRALAQLPQVTLVRRRSGANRGAAALPVAGPLKVLVVAAAADHETRLRSLAPLLETGVPAQFTVLEVADLAQVEEAVRADAYHVVHIDGPGGAPSLQLTDEDGRPSPVTPVELVRAVRRDDEPVPVIFLAGGCVGVDGVAANLIRFGADRVVVMQARPAPGYAVHLAAAFYRRLAEQNGPAGVALAYARTVVVPGGDETPQYGLPTLLATDDDRPVLDAYATPRSLDGVGRVGNAGYPMELPPGRLVGRAEQVKATVRALQRPTGNGPGGAGVILTGAPGVGKTSVAGRVMARLRGQGWTIVTHSGRWNPEALLTGLADALAKESSMEEVSRLLRDAAVDDAGKLGVVRQLLRARRLLLVFDGLDQNLSEYGEGLADSGFASVLARLAASAGKGRLLLTARDSSPAAGLDLTRVDVPPLNRQEAQRLVDRMTGLRALDEATRATVVRTVSGLPRLVELADALARDGAADFAAALAAIERAPADAREVLVTALFRRRTHGEREALLQASTCLGPISAEDLAVALHGPHVGQFDTDDAERALTALVDLALMARVEGSGGVRYAAQPWVGEAVAAHHDGEAGERHARAVAVHDRRRHAGTATFADLSETVRHLAGAHSFGGVATVAVGGLDRLGGALSRAALLNQVTRAVPAETAGFLELVYRELDELGALGLTGAARARAADVLGGELRIAAQQPAELAAQRGLSLLLSRAGELELAAGDQVAAEALFREDLAGTERLVSVFPRHPVLRRDLSVCHERLGEVWLAAGDVDEAERHFRRGLALLAQLVEADAADPALRRDLSVAHNKLGELMLAAGRTAEAAERFESALQIRQRLLDAEPGDPERQRDLTVSLERLADAALAAGQPEQAQGLLRKAITIREDLVADDPTNVTHQHELSLLEVRLGGALAAAGSVSKAEHSLREGLDVLSRLAANATGDAVLREDLRYAYHHLAEVLTRRGRNREAREMRERESALVAAPGCRSDDLSVDIDATSELR
ncbi:AAA family ATPase [Luedemannella helvata]|uniref:Tetratricopeptide repeat protein n=1 Tax=Luedemannella helvata TaxID=349315 RepID=A0ABP4WY75_9ACTN